MFWDIWRRKIEKPEISDDAVESIFFVGYEFKKCLLEVQQAIMIYCLTR